MINETILESYHTRPVDPKLEVGIEIEVEGNPIPHIERMEWWAQDRDGSLRGDSAEYILRKPCNRDKVPARLRFLIKKLDAIGAKLELSARCGVHIHINCQQLTVKQVINFVVIYYILEELLTRYCGKEREGNLFCLRSSDAEEMLRLMVEVKEKGSFLPITRNADYRYAALNIIALRKFGTLEFRALPTPDDLADINTWVEILLSIHDYAIQIGDLRGVIEGISKHGAKHIVKTVLGKHAHLIKHPWQNSVMRGVWNVQDIVYAEYMPLKRKKGRKEEEEAVINPLKWENVAGEPAPFEDDMEEPPREGPAWREREMALLRERRDKMLRRQLEEEGGRHPARPKRILRDDE